MSVRSVVCWVETRTGALSLARRFGSKSIPASAGWPHVLGSVATFLFLMQVMTGALLAFNYSASPSAAWNSVHFIDSQVPSGRLIRGLHHWGSSAMIVVVIGHMTQVFLTGAYRKPREATWVIGVVLLLLVLSFGLTGYLLPWDNRGYWGTVVTTQIVGNVPAGGRLVTNLLGGTHVGAVTLSRFYALHSVALPILATTLIGIHLALVMRHGVAPVARELTQPATFYPRQAFKDAVAVFICFTLLFGAAIVVKTPLEKIADPADLSYLPRPEWYFLFLFESLKFFRGGFEPIATAVLPAVAISMLMLAPFLDRFQKDLLLRKFLATAAVLFAVSIWGALTWRAVAASPARASQSPIKKNKRTDSTAVVSAPSKTSRGAFLFASEHCGNCHSFGGSKGRLGPPLDGIAFGRDREWIHKHFLSPQALVPGSIMPAYHFDEQDEAAIIEYLSIPQ